MLQLDASGGMEAEKARRQEEMRKKLEEGGRKLGDVRVRLRCRQRREELEAACQHC